MVSLGTLLFTRRKGELVGEDDQGNKYYRERGVADPKTQRRWVIYNGEVEASRVPPDWHAWLHRTSDEIPPKGGYPRKPWMRPHQPNLTGTAQAYRPPGHPLSAEPARAPSASGDYQAWTPGS